ncbi:hypothetical protein N5W20_03660 [Candidatus Kirkpatrickella diaphorinae]|uniref:Pertussis toxin subunit 1 n=1 Tax=Candidatus Kirkpatrickella diaphorinae TaxID=2984322 RepID=A0ABY6GK97_9PROT|nr:hypothetical protein [Candidatus Kirkpatrickella diaphorinae]UYH51963.1 hypothetical protein N5W20_03660 [Candidatus Kirkpatrickella diaphorinae]
MKFLNASLVIASMMFASVSHAKAAPLVVYTVSFQPPESIFSAGLTSDGTEKDLNRFLAGKGASGEKSAYLPLTEAMSHATRISEALTRDKPHGTVYVYYVRPTKNFYNIVDSRRFAEEILPQGVAKKELNDIWFSTRYWVEDEWAADTSISNEQIMGVRTLTWHDDVPELGAFSPNPNYISAVSEVSQRPMPPRNTPIDAAEVAKNGKGIDFIPASIAEMACTPQHLNLAASPSGLCLPLERLSTSKLHERKVAKMIVTNVFSISGSGQL